MTRTILLWAWVGFLGCSDEDNTTEAEGCDSCSENQICVIEFGETKVERCETLPEICNGTGSCTEMDCVSAMYDYCPEETGATGCSDTYPPTVISCNL